MAIKGALEMLVEAFNRQEPHAMEDAPDLDPRIRVEIASLLRRHQ